MAGGDGFEDVIDLTSDVEELTEIQQRPSKKTRLAGSESATGSGRDGPDRRAVQPAAAAVVAAAGEGPPAGGGGQRTAAAAAAGAAALARAAAASAAGGHPVVNTRSSALSPGRVGHISTQHQVPGGASKHAVPQGAGAAPQQAQGGTCYGSGHAACANDCADGSSTRALAAALGTANTGGASGSGGGVQASSGAVLTHTAGARQQAARVRAARQLQLRMLLTQVQQVQLRCALDRPFAPQRINGTQLQAALAAVLRPHVPRPVLPESQHTFSLLSYNIWFESTCGEERMAAVGRIVEEAGRPTFVLLQECTHYFYLLLASQPWWHAYHATPLPLVPPLGPHYFTALLWRKDSVHSARLLEPHEFANSCMGRDVKSVCGNIGGTVVRVSTTHLESPMGGPRQSFWKERSEQMREMLGQLDAAPEPNSLVAGDMNWIRINGEDPPVGLPQGWQDVWLQLRPGEQGWTYDTAVCPQKGRKYGPGSRLDRLFARLPDWEPQLIEMVGRQPIPGLTRVVRTGRAARSERSIPVWPSDHFGLHARFVRKLAAT